jgi:hypothetical protein
VSSTRSALLVINGLSAPSIMYLDPETPREVLDRMKPSEELMDEACLGDVELF